MSSLTQSRIAELLEPYLEAPVDALSGPAAESSILLAQAADKAAVEQLGVYLDLLLRWNARTNLTAIRTPEEIVRRHFGESLFAGRALQGVLGDGDTLLDFGSGAGFPGLPIAILLPGLYVTLAESQNKKATFLREAVRQLGLEVEVWASRVSSMPPTRSFSAVILRAVDAMQLAEEEARQRVATGGWLLTLHGGEPLTNSLAIPESDRRWLTLRKM
jgi:16S rRNA (guanine527-N7)-methyltransferase